MYHYLVLISELKRKSKHKNIMVGQIKKIDYELTIKIAIQILTMFFFYTNMNFSEHQCAY